MSVGGLSSIKAFTSLFDQAKIEKSVDERAGRLFLRVIKKGEEDIQPEVKLEVRFWTKPFLRFRKDQYKFQDNISILCENLKKSLLCIRDASEIDLQALSLACFQYEKLLKTHPKSATFSEQSFFVIARQLLLGDIAAEDVGFRECVLKTIETAQESFNFELSKPEKQFFQRLFWTTSAERNAEIDSYRGIMRPILQCFQELQARKGVPPKTSETGFGSKPKEVLSAETRPPGPSDRVLQGDILDSSEAQRREMIRGKLGVLLEQIEECNAKSLSLGMTQKFIEIPLMMAQIEDPGMSCKKDFLDAVEEKMNTLQADFLVFNAAVESRAEEVLREKLSSQDILKKSEILKMEPHPDLEGGLLVTKPLSLETRQPGILSSDLAIVDQIERTSRVNDQLRGNIQIAEKILIQLKKKFPNVPQAVFSSQSPVQIAGDDKGKVLESLLKEQKSLERTVYLYEIEIGKFLPQMTSLIEHFLSDIAASQIQLAFIEREENFGTDEDMAAKCQMLKTKIEQLFIQCTLLNQQNFDFLKRIVDDSSIEAFFEQIEEDTGEVKHHLARLEENIRRVKNYREKNMEALQHLLEQMETCNAKALSLTMEQKSTEAIQNILRKLKDRAVWCSEKTLRDMEHQVETMQTEFEAFNATVLLALEKASIKQGVVQKKDFEGQNVVVKEQKGERVEERFDQYSKKVSVDQPIGQPESEDVSLEVRSVSPVEQGFQQVAPTSVKSLRSLSQDTPENIPEPESLPKPGSALSDVRSDKGWRSVSDLNVEVIDNVLSRYNLIVPKEHSGPPPSASLEKSRLGSATSAAGVSGVIKTSLSGGVDTPSMHVSDTRSAFPKKDSVRPDGRASSKLDDSIASPKESVSKLKVSKKIVVPSKDEIKERFRALLQRLVLLKDVSVVSEEVEKEKSSIDSFLQVIDEKTLEPEAILFYQRQIGLAESRIDDCEKKISKQKDQVKKERVPVGPTIKSQKKTPQQVMEPKTPQQVVKPKTVQYVSEETLRDMLRSYNDVLDSCEAFLREYPGSEDCTKLKADIILKKQYFEQIKNLEAIALVYYRQEIKDFKKKIAVIRKENEDRKKLVERKQKEQEKAVRKQEEKKREVQIGRVADELKVKKSDKREKVNAILLREDPLRFWQQINPMERYLISLPEILHFDQLSDWEKKIVVEMQKIAKGMSEKSDIFEKVRKNVQFGAPDATVKTVLRRIIDSGPKSELYSAGGYHPEPSKMDESFITIAKYVAGSYVWKNPNVSYILDDKLWLLRCDVVEMYAAYTVFRSEVAAALKKCRDMGREDLYGQVSAANIKIASMIGIPIYDSTGKPMQVFLAELAVQKKKIEELFEPL